MRISMLDGRLASAAGLVRQGARFADIGTDHAHLPLALLREGRIESAVCSDINRGPLESAMANARDAGFFDKIKFVLTDGAAALAGEGLSDVAICGMGGELIAAIIDAAPFLKDENTRLILQPMSRQGQLRSYLAKNGFAVIKEVYSYSQGKYYVTICAEYTGECYEPKLYERELGKPEFLDTGCPECLGYLDARLKVYEKIEKGKREGGEDTCDEALLYQYIKTLRKDI